jgi:hypothetical protein
MGEAAREHVEQSRFGWDNSLERLFTDVYPRAIETRALSAEQRRSDGYAESVA